MIALSSVLIISVTARAGQPVNIFELAQEERKEFSEKVVSATKNEQAIDESPAVVTVLSRAWLDQLGVRTIGEALRYVPGLYVIDDFVTANVGVRGLHGGPESWSRLIKVLVDGAPISFPTTGGAALGPEFIPLEVVEAIEVIRGPGSALYGSNAYLGVVNVITRASRAGGSAVLSLDAGVSVKSFAGRAGAAVAVGSASSQTELLVGAAGFLEDRSGLSVPAVSPRYEELRGVRTAGDRSRPLSLLLRGTVDGKKLGTLQVRAIYQRTDASSEFSTHSSLSHATVTNQHTIVGRLDYRNDWLDKKLALHLFGQVTLGESLPGDRIDVENAAFTVERKRQNTSWFTGGELSFNYRKHSVLAGFDALIGRDAGDTVYRINREASTGGLAGEPTLVARGEVLNYSDLAPYIQAVFYPLDNFGITAGARYDVTTLGGNAFSSRAGVVYKPIEEVSIKLLYGSSFMPPAPSQLLAFPLRVGGFSGNPLLRSQTAHTVELAGSYVPADFLRVQLNAYWVRADNRIEFVDAGLTLNSKNLTSSDSFGGELLVDSQWRFLFAQLAVSFQYTRLLEPEVLPTYWTLLYGENAPLSSYAPSYPPVHGHLTAGVRFPEYHFQASATLYAAAARKGSLNNIRFASRAYVLPAYATVDVYISTLGLKLLPVGTTEFSLKVMNLTNTSYAEPGSLGVDIPARGITVLGGLRQDF